MYTYNFAVVTCKCIFLTRLPTPWGENNDFGLENLVNKCTCVLNEWTLKE